MNPRQSVLIAMFLSVAVFLLAHARASSLTTTIGSLKQVPAAPLPIRPPAAVDQRPIGGPRLA